MQLTLFNTLLISMICIFSSQAKGGLILWEFEGTLSPPQSDPLGIGGETIHFHTEFDASDVWVEGIPLSNGTPTLYFPSISATSSITGAHTIAIWNSSPAAGYFSGTGIGGIRAGVNVPFYVSFIIDGLLTKTFSPNGPPPLMPSPGENLRIEHLRDDPEAIGSLRDPISGLFYDYIDNSVSIVPVPEPPTFYLIALGLILLAAITQRKNLNISSFS